MIDQRKDLTKEELNLIAKFSSGWEINPLSENENHDKSIEKYISNFNGLILELIFRDRKIGRGFPDISGYPFYNILFNVKYKGLTLGQANYTNNPAFSEHSSLEIDSLLQRARTEAWRNYDEGANIAKKLAQEFDFTLQDV